MKYLKTFEQRKFKSGDTVKYKYSNSQPFEIIDWISDMRSYRVKDLRNSKISFLDPHEIEFYPRNKLKDWYINQKAKEYNI